MSDKTEVVTTRVSENTREWLDYLARRQFSTRASVLARIIEETVSRAVCCDRGPHGCDHVWCSECHGWSKDTGGMDPDTEEAVWSCCHRSGFSRTTGRPMDSDPFATASDMKILGGGQ